MSWHRTTLLLIKENSLFLIEFLFVMFLKRFPRIQNHYGRFLVKGIFFKKSHLKICLLFLEREEGRKRNIDQLPPLRAPTRDGTHNLLKYGTVLQLTEPSERGLYSLLCGMLRVRTRLCPERRLSWIAVLFPTSYFHWKPNFLSFCSSHNESFRTAFLKS